MKISINHSVLNNDLQFILTISNRDLESSMNNFGDHIFENMVSSIKTAPVQMIGCEVLDKLYYLVRRDEQSTKLESENKHLREVNNQLIQAMGNSINQLSPMKRKKILSSSQEKLKVSKSLGDE